MGTSLHAQNPVEPGELIIENPTLICLGFEWRIDGDENENAHAEVRYRKAGSPQWAESLPLYRIGAERTANYGFGNFRDPNHAKRYTIPAAVSGSILDLEPGTEYEVELKLIDPDGVCGEAIRELTLSTRPEPVPYEGGEVRHVYPPGYKEEKKEPAYHSIMHAVNGFHPWCDCYQTVHINPAPPGTTIKVHAGLYKLKYNDYRAFNNLWLHGQRTLIADGEPGKPIAIVAAGDGEVIIDAGGADVAFHVMAADYLYFEGLTIKNARIAFHGGLQGVMGNKGLTVKNCWFDNIQFGVLAQDGRSEDFYIADNVFLGANPLDRFNPWSGGAYGRTKGGYAVNLSGKGHVVCYNYAAGFWDTLNVFTNALADPALNQQARSIDFYNNDIFNATDNFMEMDGGYANIRALRNRMINCMASPVSMQKVYAGPGYWIRNVIWNAGRGASAIKPDGSAEVMVFLNNTSSCHFLTFQVERFDIRNNIFAGSSVIEPHHRTGELRPVARFKDSNVHSHVDHNAYLIGAQVEPKFSVGGQEYIGLEALMNGSGYEQHGFSFADYNVFTKAEEPTHAASNKDPLVYPEDINLMPASNSPLIDQAAIIPGFTKNFEGAAPDLGAYESGTEPPIYGPRDPKMRERLAPILNGSDLPEWTVNVAGPIWDDEE